MVGTIHEKCTAVVCHLVLSYRHTNKENFGYGGTSLAWITYHSALNLLKLKFAYSKQQKTEQKGGVHLESSAKFLCGTRISLGTIPSPQGNLVSV